MASPESECMSMAIYLENGENPTEWQHGCDAGTNYDYNNYGS